MNEQEQDGRQMTLEEMFCNQFVAPQIQEFFSVIEGYRENHPKSAMEFRDFIGTIEKYLQNFHIVDKDLMALASSLEKYTS